jgi:hypothetical protein
VLQYHINVERENRQSVEETRTAKCDSDCSNKKKKMCRLMTTNPAEGVIGIKSICFRCRNASSDGQGKGIGANEL